MATPPVHDGGDDELLVRYLLGELPEDERERLQEAFFTDDVLFARLLVAEDDLIDEYVRGTLTEAQRRRFEQRFVQAPGQAGRLRFARALRYAAGAPAEGAGPAPVPAKAPEAEVPRRRPPTWAAMAAAALLAAVLGLAWWAAHRGQGPGHPIAGPATVPPAPPSPPTARPASPSPQRAEAPPSAGPPAQRGAAEAAVASLSLGAGLLRGDPAAPQVTLAPATRWVRMRIELGAAARREVRYEVVLQTASGAEAFRQGGLAPEGGEAAPSLTLRLPASSLTQRDYVVLLTAEHPDGSRQYLRGYAFRVARGPGG